MINTSPRQPHSAGLLLALAALLILPGVAPSVAAQRGGPPAYTALAAPLGVGSPGVVTLQQSGATGFTLLSGPYRLSFGGGRLVLSRAGALGGLRLALLPGPAELDLLTHVVARRALRGPGTLTVALTARAAWATASVTLTAYSAWPGLLRWTVTLVPRGGGPAADSSGADLTYTDASGRGARSPAVTLYAGAPPSGTALTYLFDPDLDSTLLYLADLTALNPYFAATNSGVVNGSYRDPRGGPPTLVGAANSGLGYTLPPASLGNLPGGRVVTVLDSYLLLDAGKPNGEVAGARRFLNGLGAIYDLIQKPVLQPANWPALGAQTARDLAGPDVLATLNGHSYLRAYVSDRRTAPELITQLNVLSGLLAYQRTTGQGEPSAGRLRATLLADLPTFYSPEYGSVVNNLPLPHGRQAGSESWYYIYDLINLARVARDDATARTLLLRSAHGAIELAHHVRYVFPRAIFYAGWRGGDGLQADVTGGYAYLMLQLYDLTHSAAYLAEAKASVERLTGYGFHLAYETHMTALAATAAARLYALTGQRHYLDLSLLPLANLFAVTWLYDCAYGSCANGAYHTFFGLSPLPWAGYIAMMEAEEAWQALREYALLTGEAAPAAARKLIAEFCRYNLSTLAYTLPTQLPRGVAGPAPAEYGFVPRNRLDLAIPLEDLREGSQPSGQIGQEIYGAGGALALGGLASTRLASNLWLTSAYPLTVAHQRGGVALRLTGVASYTVTVTLTGPGVGALQAIHDAVGHTLPLTRTGQTLTFQAEGGHSYTLTGLR